MSNKYNSYVNIALHMSGTDDVGNGVYFSGDKTIYCCCVHILHYDEYQTPVNTSVPLPV